jgi:phage protein D
MSYIDATAKVQGNNKINAGMIIQVKEVGVKFSGDYLVNEVIHNFIPDQGYNTRFKCQRNACGNR